MTNDEETGKKCEICGCECKPTLHRQVNTFGVDLKPPLVSLLATGQPQVFHLKW